MLSVKRKYGESIIIYPSESLPPDMTVAELFQDGNIEIHVFESCRQYTQLGVEAPDLLKIMRNELVE